MSKKTSLKINFIFNAVYQILVLLVPLITTPFVSRVLGPDAIGQYSFIFSIVSYFCLFANFGFNDLGTKVISESRDDKVTKSNIFYSLLFSKLILGALVLCLFLIYVFFVSNDLNTLMCYLFLGLYLLGTIFDYSFYFQGEERFVSICIRNIFIRVLTLVLIFVLIRNTEDLWIYCLILGVGQILSSLIMVFSFGKNSLCKIDLKKLEVWKYFKLSIPYFIPALSVSLFSYLNQVLLGIMGSSDAENGYYGQAMKIIQILSTLAGSISIIIFSRMSYLVQEGDESEINKKIQQTFSSFWILSLPLTLGICAISDLFVPIFFGEGYDKVIILIYILAPQIVFSPLNGLYGYLYFRPKNKIWIQTIIIFGASALNIVLALILIPRYQSIGTSISRLAAEFIQLPFLIIFSYKYISLKDSFLSGIKAFISASIMFTLVFLTKIFIGTYFNNVYIELLFLIIEGAMIYYLCEMIFKDKLIVDSANQILIFVKRKFKKNQ